MNEEITERTKMLIGMAVAAVIVALSIWILGRDNPIEQLAEKYVEEETGVQIDFTPEWTTTPD